MVVYQPAMTLQFALSLVEQKGMLELLLSQHSVHQ